MSPHGDLMRSNGEEAELLYDASLLKKLDFSKARTRFEPKISAANPGPGLLVRPLSTDDYEKGFLQLLSQLTKVGDISKEEFLDRFASMKRCANTYYVTVIEDTELGKVIGAATLVVEQKFIRNLALRAKLEDVVVNDTYRGKQLGKLIISTISLLAEELGCYKINLDCKDHMVPFYSGLGYRCEEGNANSMSIRLTADGANNAKLLCLTARENICACLRNARTNH
ncbi:probable glucosamine 6-phosphate N-acetyltransferase isoform X2 [Neocloeon triangulifer]|uniref:probable glucosamine 6-phosphate N-acetyltransferase isoform X2 n=1 Tax=Neocloeon triangulifer TaxID=2078957 RepID=UPI00286EC284|nr:probable glucosamine 6-phosphate N-acetyltransferase isoform X2 [Neocloeon triangulifer]